MPDPERTVSRSLAMLSQLGFTRLAALYTVAVVARRACADLARIGIDNLAWLEAIADNAERRLPVPDPSTTEHWERSHADGTGRRTGGTAQDHARTAQGR